MSVKLNSLGYETPDGTVVLSKINLTLEYGIKYGLVGPNGVGKTTLARIIAGELMPTNGSCRNNFSVPYFRQDDPRPQNFLNLSGGEWTQLRLNQTISLDADFLIFDEPTNNLDRKGREYFTQFVKAHAGGLLIISHDRKLLEFVDVILELSNLGLTRYGGNWSFYEKQSQLERARQQNNLRRSRNSLESTLAHRTQMLNRQEKRTRDGKANAKKRGLSKVEVSGKKRQAQITKSLVDKTTMNSLEVAITKSQAALHTLKTKPQIYADFPETEIENSKLIVEAYNLNFQYLDAQKPIWSKPLSFTIRGQAKIAIDGLNGSGKSTLLRIMTGASTGLGYISGHLKLGDLPYSYIDQTLVLIDQKKTVLENVSSTSGKSVTELRNLLAQFQFSGLKVNQTAYTLSGGEKLRLALAKALLADPAPQLLILDEPTNNIDIYNLDFIEATLLKFKGALIVVSHDTAFIENIGITLRLTLESTI